MSKLTTPLLLIAIIMLGVLLMRTTKSSKSVQEQSDIITKQIEEVNKMISLEGNFAEVYTLDQTQKLFFDLIPIPKQAIVIANAKTYVSYDLSKLEYNLDSKTKTVHITHIPEPEIIVDPELEFYDLKANILPFTKDELNQLNQRAKELIRQEAEKSDLIRLAEENLKLNLQKIMLVADQQGWTVEIDGTSQPITDSSTEQ